MKRVSFLRLWMQARLHAMRARNLWAVQGGLAASLRRQPAPNRLAAAAWELAEVRSAHADLWQALHDVFPLGIVATRKGGRCRG